MTLQIKIINMTYTNDKKFNFEYPKLTKFYGELDYLAILNMKKSW